MNTANVYNTSGRDLMVDSIEKGKCTGCKMCADICPQGAISFEEDAQGFWYPKINEKCVKCGLCLDKCPSLNKPEVNSTLPKVYSAWSKNEETRISSTSGGVFWELAYKFLSNGGVVVGCRYGKDWRSAEHVLARNVEELTAIKGSKYFQSDTAGIYKEVKNELEKGNKVLFCGTPCHIAAIKSFLGSEDDNLYCMDFICRSINSPKAFKAYIDELEKQYNSKVVEVHLKNKKNGWQSLASQVRFENGEESIKDKSVDWWVKGFIYNDLYTRESCYNCQYKVLPRANSDITIGDFWGIKNQSSADMFKGISVILLNNEKGNRLFGLIQNEVNYASHTIEEVLSGNPALLRNPIKTNKQDAFFDMLNAIPFSAAVRKSIEEPARRKMRKKIVNFLKEIKRIVKLTFRSDIDIRKYIYYNYLCKNVVRTSSAKIMPHKNAIIELQKNSKIVISGKKNLSIGINKLKGSKAETYVRLNEGAEWKCNNGAGLFYDTVLEVKQNACFTSGYFTANSGSVIIAHKNIEFGEDVMIGRNVIIYDSDFHTINNREGIPCNPPKKVIIEDHVWLTSNIIVQKGVTIGKDSLITAYTSVNRDVPPHSIVGGGSVGEVIKNQVSWSREFCPME